MLNYQEYPLPCYAPERSYPKDLDIKTDLFPISPSTSLASSCPNRYTLHFSRLISVYSETTDESQQALKQTGGLLSTTFGAEFDPELRGHFLLVIQQVSDAVPVAPGGTPALGSAW